MTKLGFKVRTRLDIFYKLNYLKFGFSNARAKNMYLEHIACFNDGLFYEDGQPDKNTPEKFIQSFEETHKSIVSAGFKNSNYSIPISNSRELVNGAHRLAICLYTKTKYSIKTIDTSFVPNYDQKFYENRLADSNHLKAVLSNCMEFFNDLRIIIVWPAGASACQSINENFDVAYSIKLELLQPELEKLVALVYSKEPWANFNFNINQAIRNKADQVSAPETQVNIFFVLDVSGKLPEFKERIREKIGLGKSSVHTTDDLEETIRLGRQVLSPDFELLLRFCDMQELEKLSKYITDKNYENVIIDGSSILQLYKLREAADIDLIGLNGVYGIKGLRSHEEMIYHQATPAELFASGDVNYYCGLQIISIKQLTSYKKNRNETKDSDDIALLNNIYKSQPISIIRKIKINVRQLFRKKIQSLKIIIKGKPKLYKILVSLKELTG